MPPENSDYVVVFESRPVGVQNKKSYHLSLIFAVSFLWPMFMERRSNEIEVVHSESKNL
jgi:hypothetical protein